jgi:hypothetical protein
MITHCFYDLEIGRTARGLIRVEIVDVFVQVDVASDVLVRVQVPAPRDVVPILTQIQVRDLFVKCPSSFDLSRG